MLAGKYIFQNAYTMAKLGPLSLARGRRAFQHVSLVGSLKVMNFVYVCTREALRLMDEPYRPKDIPVAPNFLCQLRYELAHENCNTLYF
jgi:hypothetical protein